MLLMFIGYVHKQINTSFGFTVLSTTIFKNSQLSKYIKIIMQVKMYQNRISNKVCGESLITVHNQNNHRIILKIDIHC